MTTLGGFFWSERKATMRAFFQGAAVAYPVFTLMVFVDSLSHQRPGGESSWLMHFLVAAYIAAFPAMFLGGVAAVWSHVGAEDRHPIAFGRPPVG